MAANFKYFPVFLFLGALIWFFVAIPATLLAQQEDEELRKLPPEIQERIKEIEESEKTDSESLTYRQTGVVPETLDENSKAEGYSERGLDSDKTEEAVKQGDLTGKKDEAEQPSVAERYFSKTLREEKVPRGKVLRPEQDLRQFGFDFFRNAGDFGADQSALVGPDYVLGPGDTLRIDIWGNIEGHYRSTIDRNGEIVLPKVGVINLWGQNFAQAKETVQKQISKYFKHFQVNVSMDALRSINVFLVGEVTAPGSYQVSSLSSVLTALSATGGPAKTGSLRRVKLLRKGQEVAVIDFYDFFRHGDNSKDVRLQSGDTILVPVAGPLVGVAGNVNRPAIYELLKGETLGDVLEMAGGVVSTAYLQKVRLERVEGHSRKVVRDVSLPAAAEGKTEAMEIALQDRDLVEIAPIAEAGGYVKLLGYVSRPGEYQLVEGMRLRDLLLPYDNLLPEFYPHAAQIIRRTPPEYRPEIITVDLQQALEGHPGHNLLLREYDEVQLFSLEEMQELPEVAVTGAVLKPGTYRLFEKMTVKDLLTVAGNLKRGAYLAEAEITRYTPQARGTEVERFYVDLEKALQGHPQHNLVLQPEDHVVVRSIPDFGERLMVTVKGEVLFPGTYAIAKSENLSSVLERAGGFTDKAYLRGAVFSRESLKETQRKQVEKLILEEEQQILRVAQEIAAGAMSAEEAKSAETLVENRKDLVEKLKEVPVTGRLVVQLQDIDRLKGTPQDIMLMGGDEIIVPENPQTVNIQGQVYNPASLSWIPGKNAGYYLNKVGGTKEDANTGEMFIVRADGTVVSRQQSGFGVSWDSENWRWNFGGFNNVVLYPGDTILVPEEFKKFDWMRELKDISTIIYQMALGAAAVASF